MAKAGHKPKRKIVGITLESSSVLLVFQPEGFAYDATLEEFLDSRYVRAGFLTNLALYQIFGDVHPTSEGIAGFRKIIGDLDQAPAVFGIKHRQWIEVETQPNPRSEAIEYDWKEEIASMRRCLDLWKIYKEYDFDKEITNIRWEKDPINGLSVIYDSHPHLPPDKAAPLTEKRIRKVVASPKINRNLFKRFQPGDTFFPALYYILHEIDDHLRDNVQIKMFDSSILNDGIFEGICCRNLIPNNLLTTIWLQFAEAIQGKKSCKQCKNCNLWFEVSHGKTNKDREYCSDLCKVIFYRKRKQEKQQGSAGQADPQTIHQEKRPLKDPKQKRENNQNKKGKKEN